MKPPPHTLTWSAAVLAAAATVLVFVGTVTGAWWLVAISILLAIVAAALFVADGDPDPSKEKQR